MKIFSSHRSGRSRNWMEKIFVGAFIVSFVFSPLSQAFAQSTTDATASSDTGTATSDVITPTVGVATSADTSTVTPPSSPTPSSSASPASSPATTNAQTPAPSTPSSNTSNSNSTNSTNNNNSNNSANPSAQTASLFTQGAGSPGPGSVATDFFNSSQFQIDKNTGAANITYPISVPPGRNSLQPDLDLTYNSQNSQLDGIFGEGWSIGIPYIERFNKSGVDNLYSTSSLNYFESSIDGEIVSTTTVTSVGTSYVARTENGTFNRYTFSSSTDSWTMIDKNGIQYSFGATSSSQQSDPNNAAHVYKWMLNTITDTNGNTVTYTYFKNSGQIYPSSTVYTNTSSTNGIFEVDFILATSTDNGPMYSTGFAVNSNYRVGEIETKVNGTWVREYNLNYGVGDNGSTTLLTSIAESGENASGTIISLPSSTFTYATLAPNWISNSVWDPTISFTATSSADDGVRVADVNGDGLPDIVQGYTNAAGATSSASYINNGADWTVTSTWDPPVSFSNNGVDQGVRIADLNGDGLPDIIQGFYNGTATTSIAWINTGNGWVTSSTWDPPVDFSNNGTDTGARLVDVNGDGLPDIVGSNGSSTYAYINNGAGWTYEPNWDPPTAFINASGTDLGVRFADVNGDGLVDLIQGYTDAGGTSHYAAYLNTGDGWSATSSSQWDPPTVFVNNGVDQGVRIADLDGNGLADIISASSTWIDNGLGWVATSSWASPTAFTLSGGADNGTRVVDVNGDGLPDILQAYTDSSGVTHENAWTNNNAFRADLLTGITYPQGGSAVIAYKSILQITDDNGNVLNGVPYPVYIVSSLTTNDDLGDFSTSTYVYYGGTYYTNGPFDHEFAGFTQVKETDGAGNVTKTYYDTSNGASSSTGQYADNFWKIGKAYRVENYDTIGDLYKVTITKWDSTSTGGNAAYVFPDDTLEMDYDGLSTHEDSANSYTWNATNGNQTQQIQWGQVTGSSTGAFATSSLGYTTNYSYASSTGSNVIGKVFDEQLLNQSSTKIQETEYYYDGLALGNIGAGNLTTQDDWISGTTYATTTRNTYNSYGLVTQTLDPRNNTTTYSYDAYNIYPATTTNALGQTTNDQYDYSTGKVTQTIDPNHLVFQTQYDGLGRPLEVLQPDQVTTSTLDEKTAYTYTDTSGAVSVQETDYLNASTTVNTYSYYDGLDRLIQTRKSATDAGEYIVTDQSYNTVGLVQKQSLPYFGSGSSKTAPTSTSALFTNYTYDPLGRVLTTVNAVGTVSDNYDNWKTTVTDADGHPKDEIHDAFGNLVQVNEYNGSSTYSTYYTYDGLKDLLHLTDANGNIRNFAYDGLGREVSSTDLHASTDTTYGIWNYTYDNAGNLTTQVDPKNQTVNYTYDGLDRVLTETYTGASGTAITYTYDNCTNGIGRLCSVSSTDAVSLDTKTYDPEGNLASETKTIGGTNYATSYTYDRQGNQLTITNPDNSEVEYTYGTGGLVTSVQEKEPGGSFNYIVSSFDYSPTDQVAVEDYENGMVTTNVYDPLQLYRLTGKLTTDNPGEMQPAGGGGGGGGFQPQFGGGLITSLMVTEPYTGSVASFTVPLGVASMTIVAYGGQGGSGGEGGSAQGNLSVTSGTTYYYGVGQAGGGPVCGTTCGPTSGGGGGGMTWFGTANSFSQGSALLVGAGGGGASGGWSVDTGGSASGGVGGFGGGGNGGYTNGISEGSGGAGGGYWGGNGLTGATQSSGYAAGQGSAGTASNGIAEGGVAGGAGGGLSGNNGTQQYDNGPTGAWGGGGGSSYMASTLTSTSTVTGVNSGNGSLQITEYPGATVYAPYLSSQNQYLLNGTTQLNRGSSTMQGGVTFQAMLNSSGTLGLQLQVEVEPLGKNFTDIPNVTSSPFIAPNGIATTTFYGLNGSYHWQAQIVDVFGNTSGWQRFSTSTYTTDFIITSQTQPTTLTENYTGAVGSTTVPSDVARLVITAYGAEGGTSGGAGGEASGTLFVIPGTVYYFNVGNQSGYNGGGSPGSGYIAAGNGGGMTWFSPTSTFTTSTVLLVAAGGGGIGGQGNNGGTGGPGSGGYAGGLSGNSGGIGSVGYCPPSGQDCANGGGGGSQTVGGSGGSPEGSGNQGGSGAVGSAGQGGNGGGGYLEAGGGGGGGAGYYGGGGGAGNGYNSGGYMGGGGGGGASYMSSLLVNTSTASGVNATSGYMTIVEYHIVPIIASYNQYNLEDTSAISDGSSTNESGVVLGATLTSNTTTSIELQAEVQPAGTPFTNTPNVTSSAYVTPGTFATTSFMGVAGSYHWQIRGVDTQGDTSAWLPFNQATSSTDFIINQIYFTYPAYGTTTPQFSNWQLQARNVTSTSSYTVQVNWGLTQPNQATSSINASGTQLLSGVNVSKTLFSGDYSNTGDPVGIVAQASLITSTSTLLATSSVSFNEDTIPATSNCGSTDIQCIAYTYDPNGNITKIVDDSATNAAITVNYTYDSLNRLITASSSNATSSGNYLQNFTYDPVGNILTGPAGTYSYAGSAGSNYADPDAVTSITTGASTSTISYYQTYQSTTGGASVTSTMTGVQAGDLLLVENGYTGNMTSSPITDNAGTLIFITSSTWHGDAHSALYYEKNTAAGSHSFHTSYGSVPSYPGVSVIEYSGASTSSPLDTFTTATGTGDPVFAPAMSSTQVNEMAVAYGNAAGVSLTAGSGFTLRGSSAVYEDNATSTMAAGTVVTTTFSGSSGLDWIDQGALIKPAGPASTGTTVTYTYDNNGNLTSSGNATDTWDYRNELLQVLNANGTSTYGYDYTGQRVEVANGTSTTYYPETTYSVNGSTTIKNIFANGILISTIQDQNTSSSNAYQYYRSITVTSTASIASGTLANFPMLVSSTLSSWESVAHGGHIQNLVSAPNGGQEPADLVFATSSANCNTAPLNFETESYSSSTGALVDWVNVPSVSTGTVIYACYDNPSVTTDQSHPSSTWNHNFEAVYHFPNTPGVGYNDSTANANNGSAVGSPTASTGEIDGAMGLNGSSTADNTEHWILGSTNGTAVASGTFSAWVNSNEFNYEYIAYQDGAGHDTFALVWPGNNAQPLYLTLGGNTSLHGTKSNFATSTWYDIAVSWNVPSSSVKFYVNGALDNTINSTSSPEGNSGDYSQIGRYSYGGGSVTGAYFGGSIDETEVSTVTLTPQWLLTEYNNQASPSTFYTLGSETGTGAGASTSTVSYISNDNLGGTNVVTAASNGALVETLDYYPYGAIRLDNTSTTQSESRKWLGQYFDQSTNLNYLQARYYSGTQGQFISQDPVFLAMGNSNQVKQLTQNDQALLLANPQSLNSYSYSKDNPITGSDPKGLDSYYNNAGDLVYSDNLNNGMIFESNDEMILYQNAQTMENHLDNPFFFQSQVETNGPWDYKAAAKNGGQQYYFFEGQLVSANDFGNINYGYAGAAGGFGPSILTDAAGTVEAYDIGNTNHGIDITNIEGNFDAANNTANIQKGINAYNSGSQVNGASVASEIGTNAAYGASSLPTLTRIVTLLTAVVQDLKSLL